MIFIQKKDFKYQIETVRIQKSMKYNLEQIHDQINRNMLSVNICDTVPLD